MNEETCGWKVVQRITGFDQTHFILVDCPLQ